MGEDNTFVEMMRARHPARVGVHVTVNGSTVEAEVIGPIDAGASYAHESRSWDLGDLERDAGAGETVVGPLRRLCVACELDAEVADRAAVLILAGSPGHIRPGGAVEA